MEPRFRREVHCRPLQHCSTEVHHRSCRLFIAALCAACIFASEAGAQCNARDVLQNELRLKKPPSARGQEVLVRSVADIPVWKTITLQAFASPLALRNALDAKGCKVGGLAAEILARPAFVVSTTRRDVKLVAVSAAEIGFKADTVTLGAVYVRVQQLGLGLAGAEIGPQLRLQYFDQPIGEFLIVGMEPIKTWSGEQVVLNVANGGAGLILIGQDGRPDAEISATSRLLFVRSDPAAPADPLGEAAAFLPP